MMIGQLTLINIVLTPLMLCTLQVENITVATAATNLRILDKGLQRRSETPGKTRP